MSSTIFGRRLPIGYKVGIGTYESVRDPKVRVGVDLNEP